MGNVLGIDCDEREFRVIEATVGRGALEIDRAMVVPLPPEVNPADPAAVGRFLRERLEALGINTKAVRACVGRKRALLRTLSLPAVPDAEMPALVRFQVIKDLSFPAEQAAIDFAVVSPDAGGKETNTRQVLAVTLRPGVLAACRTLFDAAGLKLQALGLRPFAVTRALVHGLDEDGGVATDPAKLILVFGAEGTELSVVRAGDLLYSRALKRLDPREWSEDDGTDLPTAPADTGVVALHGLVSEVQRSLAACSAQFPDCPVERVWVVGAVAIERRLTEELRSRLGLGVETVDPLARLPFSADRPDNPGAFIGALGMVLDGQGASERFVDFVRPKQPVVKRDRRKVWAVAAVGTAALVAGVVFARFQADLRARDTTIKLLQERVSISAKGALQANEIEKKYKAVKAWTDGEVNWLDELYSLASRFPESRTAVLTSFAAGTGQTGYQGGLRIEGFGRDPGSIGHMEAELFQDKRYRVRPRGVQPSYRSRDFPWRFETEIMVKSRPPAEYTGKIDASAGSGEAGAGPSRTRGPRSRAGRLDGGGGFRGPDTSASN